MMNYTGILKEDYLVNQTYDLPRFFKSDFFNTHIGEWIGEGKEVILTRVGGVIRSSNREYADLLTYAGIPVEFR